MRETELGWARQKWRWHLGVVVIYKVPAFDLGHEFKHVSVSLCRCVLPLFKPTHRFLSQGIIFFCCFVFQIMTFWPYTSSTSFKLFHFQDYSIIISSGSNISFHIFLLFKSSHNPSFKISKWWMPERQIRSLVAQSWCHINMTLKVCILLHNSKNWFTLKTA